VGSIQNRYTKIYVDDVEFKLDDKKQNAIIIGFKANELFLYLIEACHTLYRTSEFSKKVIWSIDL
jgi:hypothetical protein